MKHHKNNTQAQVPSLKTTDTKHKIFQRIGDGSQSARNPDIEPTYEGNPICRHYSDGILLRKSTDSPRKSKKIVFIKNSSPDSSQKHSDSASIGSERKTVNTKAPIMKFVYKSTAEGSPRSLVPVKDSEKECKATDLNDYLENKDHTNSIEDSTSYANSKVFTGAPPTRVKSIRIKRKNISEEKKPNENVNNKNENDNLKIKTILQTKNDTTETSSLSSREEKNIKGNPVSNFEDNFFESENDFNEIFFQGNDPFFSNGLNGTISQAIGNCQAVVTGVTPESTHHGDL